MFKSAALLIVFFLILISPITSSTAGITVIDDVTSVNKTIKLNAVTKGKFLNEGGRLVKFHVDGKSLGTNLSGGDGYAFFAYTPSSAGIFRLKAESGNDADEGSLLVAGKDDRILLIEIEVLYEGLPFSFRPVKDSPDVLQKLSKNFRIVYLTTLTGLEASKKAVRENSFPISPVLKWSGAELLDALKERGTTPYAIIASPGVIGDAEDIEKRYSFEETGTGIEVKDWKALLKHLDRNKAK